jgi:hypothetical protein
VIGASLEFLLLDQSRISSGQGNFELSGLPNLLGTLRRKVMYWNCHQWGDFSLWFRRNAEQQLPVRLERTRD